MNRWRSFVWYQCYNQHTPRDSVSPVCMIFKCSFHSIFKRYYIQFHKLNKNNLKGNYIVIIVFLPLTSLAVWLISSCDCQYIASKSYSNCHLSENFTIKGITLHWTEHNYTQMSFHQKLEIREFSRMNEGPPALHRCTHLSHKVSNKPRLDPAMSIEA